VSAGKGRGQLPGRGRPCSFQAPQCRRSRGGDDTRLYKKCRGPIASRTSPTNQATITAHAELARAWGMLQELHGLYMAEQEVPGNGDEVERRLWPSLARSVPMPPVPSRLRPQRTGEKPTERLSRTGDRVGHRQGVRGSGFPQRHVPKEVLRRHGSRRSHRVQRAGETVPAVAAGDLLAGQRDKCPVGVWRKGRGQRRYWTSRPTSSHFYGKK